jgi:hypothetical protein
MYPILKTFIHEAYSRRLMAMQLRNTVGQQGYVNQNICNILDINSKEDTNNNTNVTVLVVAAAMMPARLPGGNTFAATTASMITADVTAAINQLSVNQTAIVQHIAAMNISPPQACAALAFNLPPGIHSVSIPTQNGYAGGSFNQGRGNTQTREFRGGRRSGQGERGDQDRNPFATHMANLGCGRAQHLPQLGGFHGAAIPATGFPGATISPPMQPLQKKNTNYSNIYKRYTYWNVCFLCGFDIKDGHTSQTCPFLKANHKTGCMCKNAQQFIAAGYDPSTKGMHKSVLSTARYN